MNITFSNNLTAQQYQQVANPPDPFVAFDPNKPGTQDVWAVYTHPDRFKTYAKRPPALNATTARGRSKLYRYDPSLGQWTLVAVHDTHNRPDACENCGAGLWEHPSHYAYRTHTYMVDTSKPKVNRGRFVWAKVNGKIPDPPVLLCVCGPCRDSIR